MLYLWKETKNESGKRAETVGFSLSSRSNNTKRGFK